MYDLIGDVHGHATQLREMLKRLGYTKNGNTYKHVSKKAVFVGDFINRGPEIRDTIWLIRGMVEAGNAIAILGNHELNSIIYYIKGENGNNLLPKKNSGFYKTEREFAFYPEEWKSHRKWMRSLPLFFETEFIRAVHACWDDTNINVIKDKLNNQKLRKSLLRKIVLEPESSIGKSIWQTTRGKYFDLPKDLILRNNKKMPIRSFRMKWWESPIGKTFNGISFENKFLLPEYTIPAQIMPEINPYPVDAPIVFFGHYCRNNGISILKDNVCCVDSCVTGSKTLTAYSWQGEDKLKKNNLFRVEN
jgi:hypothetical protein